MTLTNPLMVWLAKQAKTKEETRLTQARLAKILGLSRQYVEQITRENLAPSFWVAEDLADVTLGEVPIEAWFPYWRRRPKRGRTPLPGDELIPRFNIGMRTRMRVFERDGYRCRQCGVPDRLTIDHVKPRRKGGTHDFSNLQTLCKSCNSHKASRDDSVAKAS